MNEDVGLQRAILASLQQQQQRQFVSRPAPSRQPARVTRDIAPTMPARRPPAPVAGGQNRRIGTLEREGILPIQSGNMRRSNSGPVATGSGGAARMKPAAFSQSQEVDPSTPSVETGAYDHMFRGGVQMRAGPSSGTGSTPPPQQQDKPSISSYAEKIPGWREVVRGGQIQRQNPSGSSLVFTSLEAVPRGSTSFSSELLNFIVANTAVAIGAKPTFTLACQLRPYSRRSYVPFMVGVGVSEDNTKTTFTAVTVHFNREPGAAAEVSVDTYLYESDNCLLSQIAAVESPLVVKCGLRDDVVVNLAVVVQLNAIAVSVNGDRVWKNVSVPGLNPQSQTNAVALASAGGKIGVRNLSLVEGDSSAPVPTVDRRFAEIIEQEIMEQSPNVQWDDVAGLQDAKRLLNEAVVLPLIIPEFFTGIRSPWKGVLLFGPPGTGKTLVAKAVATCAKTTFFSLSSSTLLSKFLGESEKLTRVLFQVAREKAPATIFFDEIDALMMRRGESSEHEASRRLKAEMLQQIDGAGTGAPDGKLVMVLATTNKPWDLDDAMRRRLEKRVYIPLPEREGRNELFRVHTRTLQLDSTVDLTDLAGRTEGYSGADLHQVCRDAAMMPMRRLIADKSPQQIAEMKRQGALSDIVASQSDFVAAIAKIQPSVSPSEIKRYEEWFKEFGSI